MTEISETEQKKLLLEMMQKFDSICEQYNLKYSLAYGSMLGAVRHKGFIPWDDDIDVLMPRKDYEKLLSLKYEDDTFIIKSYRYSENYYYIFAKMMNKKTYIKEANRGETDSGLFIDIQPVDYVDEGDKNFKLSVKKAMRTRNLIDHLGGNTSREESRNFIAYVLKNVGHLLLDPFRKTILSHIDNKYIKDNGAYCANFIYDPTTAPHRANLWDEITDYPFENITVKGFKNYDEYLSKKYGDYMKLPPVEEQKSLHTFKAYLK